MTIEGPFYKISPIDDHSVFFDLYLLYEVGGKNPRSEFKVASYGITLENAIKAIIRHAVYKKYKDETITLKQYLDAYKKEKEDIKSTLGKYLD